MTDDKQQKRIEERLGSIMAPYWGKEKQPMADFHQEQAIKDYTELQRRISVGAYEERSSYHYESGTWPEDGVEESLFNLEELAAKHGLEFIWHQEIGTWSLEPMSQETKIARYNADIDARNRATVENREKPWLPLQPGEEF